MKLSELQKMGTTSNPNQSMTFGEIKKFIETCILEAKAELKKEILHDLYNDPEMKKGFISIWKVLTPLIINAKDIDVTHTKDGIRFSIFENDTEYFLGAVGKSIINPVTLSVISEFEEEKKNDDDRLLNDDAKSEDLEAITE